MESFITSLTSPPAALSSLLYFATWVLRLYLEQTFEAIPPKGLHTFPLSGPFFQMSTCAQPYFRSLLKCHGLNEDFSNLLKLKNPHIHSYTLSSLTMFHHRTRPHITPYVLLTNLDCFESSPTRKQIPRRQRVLFVYY